MEKQCDMQKESGREACRVVIGGIGPGGAGTLTKEVKEAFLEADVVIGAKSVVGQLRRLHAGEAGEKVFIAGYRPDEIAEKLEAQMREKPEAAFFIAVSGDSGFFSGAQGIRRELFSRGIDAGLLSGISSLSYLCAKARVSQEGVFCVSAHGRDADIASYVRRNEKTFVLTASNAAQILKHLGEFGLAGVRVYAGEALSRGEERVITGSAADMADHEFAEPVSLLIINDNPAGLFTAGIKDSDFIRSHAPGAIDSGMPESRTDSAAAPEPPAGFSHRRAPHANSSPEPSDGCGNERTAQELPVDLARVRVPMTKREIRVQILSQLHLNEDSIVYDIGAGTGSVTVEAALTAWRGRIFAIECNPQAAELIEANCHRFSADNVRVIRGEAPEALAELPAADAVFIGGSGGKLEAIIDALCAAPCDMHVVEESACCEEGDTTPAGGSKPSAEGSPDRIRIALSAVTLETANRALEIFERYGAVNTQSVQIFASRVKKIGRYHMPEAQNPVFVMSGDFIRKKTCSDRRPPENETLSASSVCEKLSLSCARAVIAGTGSGCGKTTITMGLLKCLKNRNIKTAAFKCGPDYIDPMFHEKALGVRSGNLDLFLSDEETLKYIAATGSAGCDVSIIEGVMGYYDGVGTTEKYSTYEVARTLKSPVILTVDAKGMASSAMALIEGFAKHRRDSQIAGVIFNRLPEKLYARMAQNVREIGIEPLGFLPFDASLSLESRHLGLVTAGEIHDIVQKIEKIAAVMEKTVDVDAIIRLASKAETLDAPEPRWISGLAKMNSGQQHEDDKPGKGARKVRIACASDEAFCFSYRENHLALRKAGAEVVFFSPLRDKALPEGTDGLFIGGGYPELYAKQLEENSAMRGAIRRAAEQGMPFIAECGGFMYLHDRIEAASKRLACTNDRDTARPKAACEESRGKMYEMAGVLSGDCVRNSKLENFGYVKLRAKKDGLVAKKGDVIGAHEFHYWKSTLLSDAFTATKADGSKTWKSGVSTETLCAGFPHMFFLSEPETVRRFIAKCAEYKERRGNGADTLSGGTVCHDSATDKITTTQPRDAADARPEEAVSQSGEDAGSEDELKKYISAVHEPDKDAMRRARVCWDKSAKPLDGLGALEDAIVKIAGIARTPSPDISRRAVVVMCADNGVVCEGVTQTGQDVTRRVAQSIARGRSPVCLMANHARTDVFAVDVGMAEDVPAEYASDELRSEKVTVRKAVRGTRDITKRPAMTRSRASQTICTGIEIAKELSGKGYSLIVAGEMGIGNTTTAAATTCCVTGLAPEAVTGRGAGLSSEGLRKKIEVVRKSVQLHKPRRDDALDILSKTGGLDIAAMTGLFLGGAICSVPVIADGVVSCVSAVLADMLSPRCRDFILTSHMGKEPAAKYLLERLGQSPVIHANLALGEGTGGTALIPLLDMALAVYSASATFGDLQIDAYNRME